MLLTEVTMRVLTPLLIGLSGLSFLGFGIAFLIAPRETLALAGVVTGALTLACVTLATRAVALLRAAIQERSYAERHLLDAIKAARKAGMSWSTIGNFVGTSGEAARQRYGNKVA